ERAQATAPTFAAPALSTAPTVAEAGPALNTSFAVLEPALDTEPTFAVVDPDLDTEPTVPEVGPALNVAPTVAEAESADVAPEDELIPAFVKEANRAEPAEVDLSSALQGLARPATQPSGESASSAEEPSLDTVF